MTATLESYLAAGHPALILDRSGRTRIEVTGPDRAKFLHNLTTNEVKRLAAGSGAEAFVTSPQGKTLGHVTILAGDDRLWLRSDANGSDDLLKHLLKYGMFDDVALDDVSRSTCELHIAGPRAEEDVQRRWSELPAARELSHVSAGPALRIVRESLVGAPGLTLIGPIGEAQSLRNDLVVAGAFLLDDEAGEALRIEAGMPQFGRDVTPEILPQEVDRNDRAINFVKGCYLGQETVARLDALGHVNKVLRGLRLTGSRSDVPPDGSPIESDGKSVGKITSAAFSTGLGGPVALGYVRTAHADPGTAVEVVVGERRIAAVVSILPMPARIQ